MQETLSRCEDRNGHIIFEYDIPRLGKRVDVLLLYRGIVFCIEFKVGESRILEADVDQVLDYALDLKNFHKFSRDKVIVPILVATNHRSFSSVVQTSVYDDKVANPLILACCGMRTCGAITADGDSIHSTETQNGMNKPETAKANKRR